MKEVRLWQPQYQTPFGQLFAEAVRRAEDGAHTYSLYLEHESQEYILVTTSKDTYLGIGSLSISEQLLLCRLLDHEFEEGEDTDILLYIKQGGSALFVTKSIAPGGEQLYHLAPAR